MFANRKEAGLALAAALETYRDGDVVVLALPRGGVPVGYEIARALEAPLNVIVVRKLGAPDEPELGVGAVVDGDLPQTVLNEEVIEALAVTPEYLANEIQAQLAEIRRRQEIYRKGGPAPQLAGRTVIVVDDGIATGGTVRAALRGVRRASPAKLVLATPVAPLEALESLRTEVDDLVCLETPSDFDALGQFYHDFRQVSDEEVIHLLERANSGREDPAL